MSDMTVDITLPPSDQIVAKMRELGQLWPSFVYSRWLLGCHYNLMPVTADDDTECRCIVGEALHQLGVAEPNLVALSRLGGWMAAAQSLGRETNLDDRWIAEAQAAQDNGEPWGRAVEAATIHVALMEIDGES